MAQYGPTPPITFGVTMPVDQVDKVRAEQPALTDIIKEMEVAAMSSNNKE